MGCQPEVDGGEPNQVVPEQVLLEADRPPSVVDLQVVSRVPQCVAGREELLVGPLAEVYVRGVGQGHDAVVPGVGVALVNLDEGLSALHDRHLAPVAHVGVLGRAPDGFEIHGTSLRSYIVRSLRSEL